MNLKQTLAVCFLLWGIAHGQSAAPISDQPSQRIRVPESWAMGNLIDTVVELRYPEQARKEHLGGRVVLKIVIGKDGVVQEAVPVDENSPLAGPAAEAVKKWKFRSYIREDHPVEVESTATFEFFADTGEIKGPRPVRAPRRLRVSSGVAEGILIRRIEPVYPPEARADHLQGEVILTAIISTTGGIAQLKVLSGHPLLAEASRDAVQQWKYKPYLLNGEPIEVETTIKIVFRL